MRPWKCTRVVWTGLVRNQYEIVLYSTDPKQIEQDNIGVKVLGEAR